MRNLFTWTRQCCEEHDRCNKVENPNWYPTRLLDLSEVHGCNDDRIRLLLSKDNCLTGCYVTLSHCWGDADFFKLRKSTMLELMVGIPKTRLPQTFQDAIAVAKMMRINYIWIDSLCILQDEDDLSDWLTESLSMEDVYANGFCNIAATASTNSSQGLFRHRDLDYFRRTEISCSLGSTVNHGHSASSYTEFMPDPWREQLSDAPLNRRGWVLQERLLARRVIHFAQNELIWECRQHLASETFPYGHPLVGFESKSLKDFTVPDNDDGTPANQSKNSSVSKISQYEIWHRIAWTYQHTQLTRPSDKLIALSGIAKRFQTILGDRYIAGMWESRLASSILWTVIGNRLFVTKEDQARVPSQRPAGLLPGEVGYRAPTWSWASLDQAVLENDYRDDLLIQVDNIRLHSEVADTVSQLSDASLRLHGEVKPISFVRDDRIGERLWRPRLIPTTSYIHHYIRSVSVSLDRDIDLESDECVNRIYFVPAKRRDFPGSTDNPMDSYFIIESLLLILVDASTATYARIGMMTCTHAQILDFLQASRDQRMKICCEEYNPGSGRPYAIRLL